MGFSVWVRNQEKPGQNFCGKIRDGAGQAGAKARRFLDVYGPTKVVP
jgi:hypothetical protein